MDDEGLYLYGFARASALGEAGSAAGLDGLAEVAFRQIGGVAAVVSPIDLAEFQGEAAELNLQNPEWIIPRACRHEQVVERVMAASPVLPVRFGAVFSSPAALGAFVAEHGSAITSFLDTISGQEEWAVKGLLDTERALTAIIEADPDLAEQRRQLPSTPGGRYFREKQLLAGARKRLGRWGRELADQLETELCGVTQEGSMLRLSTRSAPPPGAELVCNLAVLLPGTAADDFRDRVQAFAARHEALGLTVTCSGPWPPYNFCPTLGEESG